MIVAVPTVDDSVLRVRRRGGTDNSFTL